MFSVIIIVDFQEGRKYILIRNFVYYIQFGLLGTLVWCILYEDFSLQTLFIGLVMGFLSVFFANAFLKKRKTQRQPFLNPLYFMGFVFYQLYSIIRSGIQVIPFIFTGKTNIGIVWIKTSVDKGLMTSLIGNGITLTPGTVTVEKNDHDLMVLWIDVKTKNKEKAGKIIKGKAESILLKGYRK